jgi:hypothetical protein
LRQALRKNVERIAGDNAIDIEFVRGNKSFRKEHRGQGSPAEAWTPAGYGVHTFSHGTMQPL